MPDETKLNAHAAAAYLGITHIQFRTLLQKAPLQGTPEGRTVSYSKRDLDDWANKGLIFATLATMRSRSKPAVLHLFEGQMTRLMHLALKAGFTNKHGFPDLVPFLDHLMDTYESQTSSTTTLDEKP